MKIYSLLLVKNEEDIIISNLRAAAQWSDKLIVMDNGSTDNTWQIVQDLAKEYPQIIPFAQDSQPFRIGLRALMFNAFKHEMTKDDWWCIRLDADEFFVENPRDFLQKIPHRYKQVWKESIDYQLTEEDIEEFEFVGDFEQDKSKIAYYNKQTWSEIRFLRYSPKHTWDIESRSPVPRGLVYPKKIRTTHYQFRSPQQLQTRFFVRQQAKANNCNSFRHEKGEDYTFYLKKRADLYKDTGSGQYPTEGSRNKHIKKRNIIFKYILTWIGYY